MTDKYTKAMLTVIAVCLCLITYETFYNEDIQKVQICDFDGCAYTSNGSLFVQ